MPSLPNTRQCPISTRPEVGGAASCFPDPTFCPASLPHCGGWCRGDSDPRRSDVTFRRPSDETCSRTFPLAVQGGWAGNPVLWEPLGAGGGWRFPRCLSQSPRQAPEVDIGVLVAEITKHVLRLLPCPRTSFPSLSRGEVPRAAAPSRSTRQPVLRLQDGGAARKERVQATRRQSRQLQC